MFKDHLPFKWHLGLAVFAAVLVTFSEPLGAEDYIIFKTGRMFLVNAEKIVENVEGQYILLEEAGHMVEILYSSIARLRIGDWFWPELPKPRSLISRDFSPRIRPIVPNEEILGLINRYSAEHGVDPNLARAVIQIESSFNQRARSSKGAIGLMQLMPETAKDLGVRNPYDPEQNIDGGTRYLESLLDQFDNDKRLAIAAYHAGPKRVEKCNCVPNTSDGRRTTKRHVDLVMEVYRQLSEEETVDNTDEADDEAEEPDNLFPKLWI
jgi:hypothetical protein